MRSLPATSGGLNEIGGDEMKRKTTKANKTMRGTKTGSKPQETSYAFASAGAGVDVRLTAHDFNWIVSHGPLTPSDREAWRESARAYLQKAA